MEITNNDVFLNDENKGSSFHDKLESTFNHIERKLNNNISNDNILESLMNSTLLLKRNQQESIAMNLFKKIIYNFLKNFGVNKFNIEYLKKNLENLETKFKSKVYGAEPATASQAPSGRIRRSQTQAQ